MVLGFLLSGGPQSTSRSALRSMRNIFASAGEKDGGASYVLISLLLHFYLLFLFLRMKKKDNHKYSHVTSKQKLSVVFLFHFLSFVIRL
jgi:hypothetical protein